MQSTQTQLQNLVETINRDRDRQLVLDKTMADLMAISAAPQPRPTHRTPRACRHRGPPPSSCEQARGALRTLQLRLKPEHPDVIRAQRVVRELEQKAQAEELNSSRRHRDRRRASDVVRRRPEATLRDAGGA